MQRLRAMALASLLVMVSCSDEAQNSTNKVEPSVVPAAPTLALRIADFKRADWPARCEADEDIFNAFCFADPDRTVSASGPLFLQQPDGTFSVECMIGGGNVRLFCLKR